MYYLITYLRIKIHFYQWFILPNLKNYLFIFYTTPFIQTFLRIVLLKELFFITLKYPDERTLPIRPEVLNGRGQTGRGGTKPKIFKWHGLTKIRSHGTRRRLDRETVPWKGKNKCSIHKRRNFSFNHLYSDVTQVRWTYRR